MFIIRFTFPSSVFIPAVFARFRLIWASVEDDDDDATPEKRLLSASCDDDNMDDDDDDASKRRKTEVPFGSSDAFSHVTILLLATTTGGSYT